MPKQTPLNEWMSIALDSWYLGLEASTVIGLRTMKMMTLEPGFEAEAVRMVSEKASAGAELAIQLAFAGPALTPASAARKTVRHYRKKVGANRKRLSARS